MKVLLFMMEYEVADYQKISNLSTGRSDYLDLPVWNAEIKFAPTPFYIYILVCKTQKYAFVFTFITEISQDILWELHRDYLVTMLG